MNLPSFPRRIGLPLAMQMIAILVCALIGAQLVTLALTVIFPPGPAARWEMADVVHALTRHEIPERLQRKVMDGPPDVTGQGWLVSQSSRDALARRLGRKSDEVVLAFYTQLPVGGVAVPTGSRSPLAVENAGGSGGLSSLLVDTAQAQSIPGGPPPGGAPAPGGMPGGSFPGGVPPGGTMPRAPAMPGGSMPHPQRMPGMQGTPAGQPGDIGAQPSAPGPTVVNRASGPGPVGASGPGPVGAGLSLIHI